MKPEDFIGPVCSCPVCSQAGLTEHPLIRDRHTGLWLHGYPLKRWYEARERFFELSKTIKPKEMPKADGASR